MPTLSGSENAGGLRFDANGMFVPRNLTAGAGGEHDELDVLAARDTQLFISAQLVLRCISIGGACKAVILNILSARNASAGGGGVAGRSAIAIL